MTIARTLREIADWDNRPPVSDESFETAMSFYDDLYPEVRERARRVLLPAPLDELTNHLLFLFAAEVAEDEGL